MKSTAGKVYLVGSGPGDPGLLTVRGRELLESAEVVVYDYLAPEEVLAYAPAGAEIIYVGKQGGQHTLSQEGINALIVEKAKEGKRVVRLKGGDPFIFGRGGEEAEELVAAGVEFEVVPGVTSAVAAAAYAGIPLTHRDYTPAVAFVTGHEREDREGTAVRWAELARSADTLVVFMGMKNLGANARRLVEGGRSADTPAAVVRLGTRPEQRTVVGTLGDIAEKAQAAGMKAPALLIVGEVVRLREKLNWFEKRPLFGRRIVVTRARAQASDLVGKLRALGAGVTEFPTIEIAPAADYAPLDAAIGRLADYDWLLFTSVNGVKFFFERLAAAGRDIRALAGLKLGAIGPATAGALEALHLKLDVVPGEYRAEAFLEVLGEDVKGKRFLLPRAEEAREILPETLREKGATVDVVVAYRTVMPGTGAGKVRELLEAGEVDAVTFTSSSTVKNFKELVGPDAPELVKNCLVAAIGPITAETARKLGFEPGLMAAEYTIDGLVKELTGRLRTP